MSSKADREADRLFPDAVIARDPKKKAVKSAFRSSMMAREMGAALAKSVDERRWAQATKVRPTAEALHNEAMGRKLGADRANAAKAPLSMALKAFDQGDLKPEIDKPTSNIQARHRGQANVTSEKGTYNLKARPARSDSVSRGRVDSSEADGFERPSAGRSAAQLTQNPFQVRSQQSVASTVEPDGNQQNSRDDKKREGETDQQFFNRRFKYYNFDPKGDSMSLTSVKNPIDATAAARAWWFAERMADEFYSGDGASAKHDTFGHILANMILASQIGVGEVKKFADAHERYNDYRTITTIKDLHNNQLGRNIYLEHGDLDWEEYAKIVKKTIDQEDPFGSEKVVIEILNRYGDNVYKLNDASIKNKKDE